MPLITIDRDWFGLLVDRYYKLEIEHRGFRVVIDDFKARNSAFANDIEGVFQMKTDALRNDWIEADSQLNSAWAVEDDDEYLRVLGQFLSERLSGK
jgi:hypothetical protein